MKEKDWSNKSGNNGHDPFAGSQNKIVQKSIELDHGIEWIAVDLEFNWQAKELERKRTLEDDNSTG